MCREVQGVPKLPYACADEELTENPASAYTTPSDLRVYELIAKVARSRAEKTTIRAALHQSRQYGLQARHQTKENRA